MGETLYQVDAFTRRPFAGNPAAVCVLETAAPEPWMQAVAREMNLAETAFLVPRADDAFDLRWFTPRVEVELCGHATLASAHVLWQTERLARSSPARFHTRSGWLTARCLEVGIEMDFPSNPPRPTRHGVALQEALGTAAVEVAEYGSDGLAVLADAAAVRQLSPNLAAIAALPFRGVTVTAPGDQDFDCVSRFFGPRVGVPEDAVTGSAHCGLAPYWSARLGKTELRAHQASERGGELELRLAGERVFLRGEAVTVLRAELLVTE
ncbi:MAG: PhzF family phenazine biosynthesis protein [Acidobacteriota bacterium]